MNILNLLVNIRYINIINQIAERTLRKPSIKPNKNKTYPNSKFEPRLKDDKGQNLPWDDSLKAIEPKAYWAHVPFISLAVLIQKPPRVFS